MASKSDVNAFVNLIAPSVIALCKEFGWGVPSAIIAQAGKESAWGTSGLWKKAYNLCGQKWASSQNRGFVEMKTKEQLKNGTYITITAKFTKYNDVADGIRGYFEFIEKYKRYVPVKNAKTYSEYAIQLKACGWATSISYAQSIISLVETYNLTRYDSMDTPASVDSPQVLPTLRIGDKNDAVRHVQQYLCDCGYELAVDGIFGPMTAETVRAYQTRWNLTHADKISVDGIWGPRTWSTVGK